MLISFLSFPVLFFHLLQLVLFYPPILSFLPFFALIIFSLLVSLTTFFPLFFVSFMHFSPLPYFLSSSVFLSPVLLLLSLPILIFSCFTSLPDVTTISLSPFHFSFLLFFFPSSVILSHNLSYFSFSFSSPPLFFPHKPSRLQRSPLASQRSIISSSLTSFLPLLPSPSFCQFSYLLSSSFPLFSFLYELPQRSTSSRLHPWPCLNSSFASAETIILVRRRQRARRLGDVLFFGS